MRRLYTALFYLLIPLILLRLIWKARRLPAYRQRMSERFFLQTKKPQPVDVWLHAASLGEVVAATPLIDALLAKSLRICVTTMTPTGSQQVQRRFGAKIEHQYIPYDLPWALKRFFATIQPRLGIIIETELWPNLITTAKAAPMKLFLANARISDKAFAQYQLVAFFFKPVLQHFNAILAQSAQDAARFCALGAPAAKVQVLGNMKFDVQTNQIERGYADTLKSQWGSTRPVLIAASTHAGEEEQLLARLIKLQEKIPGLLLLIAPRHPERFQTVFELSQHYGFRTGLRSQPNLLNDQLEVIILDSMGELMGFFHVSDYAFVGGSLVSIGGHNVLEPIALMVPTFCGPYMQNSKAICAELSANSALYCAKDADDLIEAIIQRFHDPELCQQQIGNATEVLAANQGTVIRHLTNMLDEVSCEQ